jgi:hypothetical protein
VDRCQHHTIAIIAIIATHHRPHLSCHIITKLSSSQLLSPTIRISIATTITIAIITFIVTLQATIIHHFHTTATIVVAITLLLS